MEVKKITAQSQKTTPSQKDSSLPSVEILMDKLPYNEQIERFLLGRIIADSECLPQICDMVFEETFYNQVYKTIFIAINKLNTEGSKINEITLIRKLEQEKTLEYCGGSYAISQLTEVSFFEPIISAALYLEELCMRRKMVKHSIEVMQRCFNLSQDVFDTAGFASEISDKSIMNFHSDKTLLPEHRIEATLKQISRAMHHKGLAGVPSGLWVIDSSTSGWHKGDLIIIAGRPGMGKSALLFTLMHNAADAGFPVAVFEMEMTADQVGMREISMINKIPYSKLKRGDISSGDFENIAANVVPNWVEKKIYFEWKSRATIGFIRSKMIKMKADLGIKIAMIDYLNLMGTDKSNGKNREREIAEVVEGLKGLAKDLDIPIILVAQLNRENESTTNKKPQLHNLRDSGAIEQAADIVLLLYRDEYYNPNSSLKNVLTIDIAKNKQGGTGEKEVSCFIETNTIQDSRETISQRPPETFNYHDDQPF